MILERCDNYRISMARSAFFRSVDFSVNEVVVLLAQYNFVTTHNAYDSSECVRLVQMMPQQY